MKEQKTYQIKNEEVQNGVQKINDAIRSLDYFKEYYDQSYISAMQKIFASESVGSPELTEEEKKSLISEHPAVMDFGVSTQPSEYEKEYYGMFLQFVENATRFCTKSSRSFDGGCHEYQIFGIEASRDEIVRQYGQYIYSRASMEVPFEEPKANKDVVQRDFSRASRKLCFLGDDNGPISPIIDLDLYRRYLKLEGIDTSVDFENKIFKYGEPEENITVDRPSSKALGYVASNR